MISTKGRYALRGMIDLARNENEEFVPLKDIAARQGISKKYLEILVRDMVTANLIVGVRGKGGGYKLNVDPAKCTAWDVIRATEENFSPVSCVTDDHTTCPNQTVCRTLPMWIELNTTLKTFFEKYTIADMMANEIQV